MFIELVSINRNKPYKGGMIKQHILPITKLWTIFSIFLRDTAYLFRTHSTPLECGRLDIPFSIDIALRWSAGGWIYRFLFSLRSNSTPLECIYLNVPFSMDIAPLRGVKICFFGENPCSNA